MAFTSTHKLYTSLLVVLFTMISLALHGRVLAQTVSGNGYVLNQVISPIGGALSGNGYTLSQTGQVISGIISGGGYTSQAVFGTSSIPTVIPPIVTPPSGGGGGGGGGGSWGYYVLPATTTTVIATISRTINSKTILTVNGSSCSSRIALSAPVDVGLKNDPKDVKKLQTFLNTYEKENLKITGIYGKADYLAVKKWQAKYKANILTPMKLKNPTGTVYTSSMRQIERQSTATCGQQIVVHTCPYFKAYAMYGDKNEEVKKIQQFLNIVQGEKLVINGRYDKVTVAAAKRFQRMYRKDIVSIVTLSFISGNWNISTRVKANEIIGCDKLK